MASLLLFSMLVLLAQADAQPTSALAPRPVTIATPSTTLPAALQALQQQTGVRVADRRQNRQTQPHFPLDLHGVGFWQALDTIARAADVEVSLYQPGGGIAIVDGPHRDVPTSYNGLFRVQLKRIETSRDFQSGARVCRLTLQIAWEPRFRPLFLQNGRRPLLVQDDHRASLQAIGTGAGRQSLETSRLFTEVSLLVTAPSRAARTLELIQGDLSLIGPDHTVQFTFDHLTPDAHPVQTKDGITVQLRSVDIEKGAPVHWNVGFDLQYPPSGPNFDSFESWLVTSRLRLVRKGTQGKRYLAPISYSDDTLAGHRAVFDYTFESRRGLELNQLSEWKLVYELPGPMVTLAVPFTFRHVPLP